MEYPFKEAEKMATIFEMKFVKKLGINPDEYTRRCAEVVVAVSKRNGVENPPDVVEREVVQEESKLEPVEPKSQKVDVNITVEAKQPEKTQHEITIKTEPIKTEKQEVEIKIKEEKDEETAEIKKENEKKKKAILEKMDKKLEEDDKR